MKIIVNFIHQSAVIDVEPTTTITKLKTKVYEALCVLTSMQSLIYCGVELVNDSIISDYDMQPHASIDLHLRKHITTSYARKPLPQAEIFTGTSARQHSKSYISTLSEVSAVSEISNQMSISESMNTDKELQESSRFAMRVRFNDKISSKSPNYYEDYVQSNGENSVENHGENKNKIQINLNTTSADDQSLQSMEHSELSSRNSRRSSFNFTDVYETSHLTDFTFENPLIRTEQAYQTNPAIQTLIKMDVDTLSPLSDPLPITIIIPPKTTLSEKSIAETIRTATATAPTSMATAIAATYISPLLAIFPIVSASNSTISTSISAPELSREKEKEMEKVKEREKEMSNTSTTSLDYTTGYRTVSSPERTHTHNTNTSSSTPTPPTHTLLSAPLSSSAPILSIASRTTLTPTATASLAPSAVIPLLQRDILSPKIYHTQTQQSPNKISNTQIQPLTQTQMQTQSQPQAQTLTQSLSHTQELSQSPPRARIDYSVNNNMNSPSIPDKNSQVNSSIITSSSFDRNSSMNTSMYSNINSNINSNLNTSTSSHTNSHINSHSIFVSKSPSRIPTPTLTASVPQKTIIPIASIIQNPTKSISKLIDEDDEFKVTWTKFFFQFLFIFYLFIFLMFSLSSLCILLYLFIDLY